MWACSVAAGKGPPLSEASASNHAFDNGSRINSVFKKDTNVVPFLFSEQIHAFIYDIN